MHLRAPTVLATAVVAVAALAGAGCAGADTDIQEDLAEAFEERQDLEPEVAACLAVLVIDEAGEDTLDDVNPTDEEPDPELQRALLDVAADARPMLEGEVPPDEICDEPATDGPDTTATDDGE